MPLLVQVAASVLFTGLILAALIGAWLLIDATRDAVDGWRERRRARLEAELDRKQRELRAVMFDLANRIAIERAEGEKAAVELVRRNYLATGRAPHWLSSTAGVVKKATSQFTPRFAPWLPLVTGVRTPVNR